MRATFGRVASHLSGIQGALGVCLVTGGVYVLAGVGVALVVIGGFLLLGAWGSR